MLSAKNVFINRIHDEVDRGQFDMALCTVSPLHSQITSLGLLSYYLLERRENGIFISITRPYFYMERLLKKEGVPLDTLISFDALGRDLEGTMDQRTARSSLICAHLSKKIRQLLEKDPSIRFILIDNISGLLPYVSPSSIVQFIDEVHEQMMISADLHVIILVDHEIDPLVTKGIQGLCDRQFDISPGIFR